MTHQDLFKLIQTVQKNVRCPQCGKAYTFTNIKIRGIVESIIFLELNCRNHMPLLATVSLTQSARRTKKIQKKITPNDVIETHKFFKDFSGSLKQVFKNIK